jgi:hypothetical protein
MGECYKNLKFFRNMVHLKSWRRRERAETHPPPGRSLQQEQLPRPQLLQQDVCQRIDAMNIEEEAGEVVLLLFKT